tara:strand:+ start:48 stop:515 length:468 start_codon:yes stop_codon:yes gene_type:complete
MIKKEKIIYGLVVIIAIIAFPFIQVILKGFIALALIYVLKNPYLIPLAILLVIEFTILIFNQKYRETRKKSLLKLVRSTQNLFRGIGLAEKEIMRRIGSTSNYLSEAKKTTSKRRRRVNSNISDADELKKYAELRDQGIITEEEFHDKKKILLDL